MEDLGWAFWVVWVPLFGIVPLGLLVYYALWSSRRLDPARPFRVQLRALLPGLAVGVGVWLVFLCMAFCGVTFVGIEETSTSTLNTLFLAANPVLLPLIAGSVLFYFVPAPEANALEMVVSMAVIPLVVPPLLLLLLSYAAWLVRRASRHSPSTPARAA